MSASVFPTVVPLRVRDIGRLQRDLPVHRWDEVLVDDLEALCRGVLKAGGGGQLERADFDEALDYLLESVFVVAQRFDETRRGIVFRPWLFQRLRWRLMDWFREEYFSRPAPIAEVHIDEPVDDVDIDDELLFATLMGVLDERERHLVELRLEDRSFTELGKELGVSRPAARETHKRAVTKLRAAAEAAGIIANVSQPL